MPSVFNHDSSCWGVKRSYCNVLQYDLIEDLQSRKLGHQEQNTEAAPNTNFMHYSVSSNGYYGYQPHTITQGESNEDIEMDVEENVSLSSADEPPLVNTNVHDCRSLNSTVHLQTVKRKRQMPSNYLDNIKRTRQEEGETRLKSSAEESHRKKCFAFLTECGDGGGSGVRQRRHRLNRLGLVDVEYESTAQLLMQTHGCELYLFGRTCDY